MTSLHGNFNGVFREDYKSICTKDSVKDALDKGEYVNEKEKLWLTSTREDFKGKINSIDQRQLQSHSRDRANLVLGFDKVKYLTTTKDYRPHQTFHSPSRVHFDTTTNIPDFCRKYNDNLKLENSEYQNKYSTNDYTEQPLVRSLKERQNYTNDLRSTHFQLGNCERKEGSETKHSFTYFRNPCNNNNSNGGALETFKSRVFREGDWNKTDRCLLTESVTQKDFGANSVESCREGAQTEYHQKTHFNLGSLKNSSNSTYKDDYWSKAHQATANNSTTLYKPFNSEIFPRAEQQEFISTHRNSFKQKDKQLTLQVKRERESDLNRNMGKHSLKSVPMSFMEEQTASIPRKFISMNQSAYHMQYPTKRLPAVEKTPTYNHLQETANHCKQTRSEFQDSYGAHEQQASKVRNESTIRQNENKSTHFVFGTNEFGDTTRSEHVSQYSERLPLNPSLLAAGKSMPHSKAYSHIFSCSDECQQSALLESIMKNDYKVRNCGSAQSSIYNKPALMMKPPAMNTHFFHMDEGYKGSFKSTTQTHFITPPAKYRSIDAEV